MPAISRSRPPRANGPSSTSPVPAARSALSPAKLLSRSPAARTPPVKEGHQISGEDAASCGLITKGNGAPAAVKGPIITSDRVGVGAAVVGGGLTIWVLAQRDDPVSPTKQ